MKSLLIIGEYHNQNLNKNIKRLQKYAREEKLNPRLLNYEELFQGKVPRFPTQKVEIMLFFPYYFWDKNCETPSDTAIYGTSKQSHNLFKEFLIETGERIKNLLSDKEISYVIDPKSASIDRDKLATKQLLRGFGIPTIRDLPHNLEKILNFSKEKGVFIKARYGAGGKGITYLSPEGWFTNYRVGRGNTIRNHKEESDWKFSEITGNREFLERLLGLEVIIEEEIIPPLLTKGLKFDIRAYSVFGRIPHMFIRENSIKNIITNYTQGGTVYHNYKKTLSIRTISSIKETASQTAKAFDSKFLGVDIIFDRDLKTPLVLEVQTFTGFPKIRKCNISKYLAQQIKTAT